MAGCSAHVAATTRSGATTTPRPGVGGVPVGRGLRVAQLVRDQAGDGEVVPTWNYLVVHASGPLIVHDDIRWVRGQAGMLTKQQEASQPSPWKMADAPREYTEANLAQIVGLEIPIERLIGKSKASQNRRGDDREGAIAGLRGTGDPGDAAMAERMDAIRQR